MDDGTTNIELKSAQEAKVKMNVEINKREQMKLEALQLLEQGSRTMSKEVVECCRQLMADM